MLVAGLTGGIGSGKSTVATMLGSRGAVVIDADAITRELQQPGEPVFDAMVERFGPGIVAADGTLDRAAVAAIVFADDAARKDLEQIVHPAVGAEMLRRLQPYVDTDTVVVYDVPLLVEAARRGYAAVVVVDVDPEVAVRRLVSARDMDEADARARIANQATREQRRAVADRVIDNSGTLADLERQVDDVWSWLRTLADQTAAPHEPPPAAGTGRRDQLALFASLWAIATLFHVWVNPRALAFADDATLVGATHLVLVVLALVVLAVPDRLGPLVALCSVIVVSAWCEAPLIGNHWVLAALISAGVVLVVATARGDRDAVAERALPVIRDTTLVFYLFAAFAKLNDGFFNVDVSCAVFFLDESLSSYGIDGIRASGSAVFGRVVIALSALTELSVPVLLMVRRTRTLGVLVALAFHFVVALDRTHLFSDFSSGLDAVFVLFLPAGFATWARRQRDRIPLVAGLALAAAAVLVTLPLAGPYSQGNFDLFDDGRKLAWFVVGPVIVAAAAVWVLRNRQAPAEDRILGLSPRSLTPRWLAVVPVVAVLNGLTPYLELKTGFGWNMYANLRTAGGDTNHFVVPATLDLLGEQDELVTVVSSSDPRLQVYAQTGYRLAWLQFRGHLADNPGEAVTFVYRGETRTLARADEDPDLVAPVPAWREKLQVYRAVDAQDPPRCQASFLPAR